MLFRSKSSILKAKGEIAEAITFGPAPFAEKDKLKMAEYEHDMESIKHDAEELTQASAHHLHLHEAIERGVTFFHIAIAVVAISVLTKRKMAWFVSLAFGVIGLVFVVQALVGASGHH